MTRIAVRRLGHKLEGGEGGENKISAQQPDGDRGKAKRRALDASLHVSEEVEV